MKVTEILQQDMKFSYPQIHSVRLNTFFTFVRSGMQDQRVSVTYLGRGLKDESNTHIKHDIKRADRLIGNHHLHNDRLYFYEHMTSLLVGNKKHPLVIVDWSPINGNEIFQVIRASIPMGGRALTLYEKVYKESELNTKKAHDEFLDALESCLPFDTQPIILSDAIFKTPWFESIERKGWFWVGRVRGNVLLSLDKKSWSSCKLWFENASSRAKKIDTVYYSKSSEFKCKGVLYKGKNGHRIKRKKRGGKSQCTTDKYQQQKATEPWLLIFNLPSRVSVKANKVVNIYRQRMQIEESFRDTKNGKLGVSLEYANSKSVERYDNLLLIAAVMLFALWSLGFVSSQLGQARYLQANTIKHRAVLSYVYIGREVVNDYRYCPDEPLFNYIYSQLSELAISVEHL